MRLAALAAIPLVAIMLQVPAAGAASEVHLVAVGDFGARAATNTVLTEVAAQSPDAALALGDLAYRDLPTEYAWCDYVKQRVGEGFPFELIAGNHESLDVNDGDINNYSACLPNQIPGVVGTYGREYYMDLPTGAPLVRVINASPALTFEDGRWDYAEGDAHYDWVSDAIDDGRADGAQWIVVTAHVPCLSVGVYSCPGERDFYELMLAKDVDLVLHGHEHAYMRTHQLTSGTPQCPALAGNGFDEDCVADSDDSFYQGQGTVFATVGTGGTPLRDVDADDTQAGYFASVSGANLDPTYGLLSIRATDAALSAEFVATSGTGLSDAFTIQVGEPPNEPPVAAITTTIDERDLTADGTNSTDPDGTITSYDWDFGDDTTDTGPTVTHTYDTDGTYTITLTVTDDNDATHTTTTDVTITTTPPPNEPPVAAITTTIDERDLTADGTNSTDPDGTITSYDWDFGDDTTDTGPTVTHTYDTDGTYTITLTVTDDNDATHTTTTDVTITTTPPPIAEDSFDRIVASGWGTAPVGGPWTTSPNNPTGLLTVQDGVGLLRHTSSGSSRAAYLDSVSSTETLVDVTLTPDKVTTGGGLYVNVTGRRVDGGGQYRAKMRLRSDRQVELGPVRVTATWSEIALQNRILLPFTYEAGMPMRVRVEVSGTNPTTVRGKAWPADAAEPENWQFSAEDTTTAMHAPGGIGINTYYSSSATNTPLILTVDDLLAVTP